VSVFLILGIAGVMVLLVSLILGDLLDSALHFDGLDSEVFSTSVIAAFVGAFGFGGVAVHEFTDSVWLASLVGLVAGSLAGWGAVALTRWLKRAGNRAGASQRPLGRGGGPRHHGHSGRWFW